MSCRLACLLALGATLIARPASAAEILLVSNAGGDTNIATALRADGHTVTMATGHAMLAGDLSAYDAVFWSATASWDVPATTFTNLTTYVMGGGRVFVTGYDSIISNTALASFCGGTGARDLVGSPPPGVIASIENSLTVGVADLRGMTPSGGHTDRDGLTGLMADTVEVCPSASGGTVQWSLRTLGSGEIAWVSNGTYGGTHASWETVGNPFNGAIRNFAAAADFAMGDPGAPVIEFAPTSPVDEGSEATLTVTLEDREGDTYTFSWDLDDDGTFGENAGMTSYTIPAGTTDGPASLRFGVQARDARGNTSVRYRTIRINNVDPQVTSTPPLTTSVGVDLRYSIVVSDPAGTLDPPTFMLARGPSRMTVTPAGVVQWTPTDSDVTRPGETLSIEIVIDDGDMGAARHAWEMTVSPNRRPTPPVPAYPTEMIAIIDPTPRLAAANSQDLDLDELTYFFEIDTADTFDSPDLRQSGPLAETPGFTAWQMAMPLAEAQLYHWRVWSNDGTIDSEPRQTAFYVVRDPSLPPPDAGPRDGGSTGGPDSGLIPGLDAGTGGGGGGCGCRAAPAPGGPLALALGALALLALRRRRG